jgi:hypothetical protein
MCVYSGCQPAGALRSRVYVGSSRSRLSQVCRARYLISSLNRRVLRAIHQMNLLRVNYSATTTMSLLCIRYNGAKTSWAYILCICVCACFARFNLLYITARWTPRDRRRTRSKAAAEIACYTIKRARTEPSVPHLGALGRRAANTHGKQLSHTHLHTRCNNLAETVQHRRVKHFAGQKFNAATGVIIVFFFQRSQRTRLVGI